MSCKEHADTSEFADECEVCTYIEVQKLRAEREVLLVFEKFASRRGHKNCVLQIQQLEKEIVTLKEEIIGIFLAAAGASR